MSLELLAPLKRKTITETLVERLGDLIIEGYWKPGTQIPHENDLAATFGVGRTTVREALQVLHYMGYLESEAYRGYKVSKGSSEFLVRTISWAISLGQRDYRELIAARQIIEPPVAALAAAAMDDATIVKLQACIEQMEADIDDEERFLLADRDFHVTVAEACGNRVLVRLTVLLRDFLWKSLKIPHSIPPSLVEHKAIFEALRARDTAAARSAMERHVSNIAERSLAVSPARTGDKDAGKSS